MGVIKLDNLTFQPTVKVDTSDDDKPILPGSGPVVQNAASLAIDPKSVGWKNAVDDGKGKPQNEDVKGDPKLKKDLNAQLANAQVNPMGVGSGTKKGTNQGGNTVQGEHTDARTPSGDAVTLAEGRTHTIPASVYHGEKTPGNKYQGEWKDNPDAPDSAVDFGVGVTIHTDLNKSFNKSLFTANESDSAVLGSLGGKSSVDLAGIGDKVGINVDPKNTTLDVNAGAGNAFGYARAGWVGQTPGDAGYAVAAYVETSAVNVSADFNHTQKLGKNDSISVNNYTEAALVAGYANAEGHATIGKSGISIGGDLSVGGGLAKVTNITQADYKHNGKRVASARMLHEAYVGGGGVGIGGHVDLSWKKVSVDGKFGWGPATHSMRVDVDVEAAGQLAKEKAQEVLGKENYETVVEVSSNVYGTAKEMVTNPMQTLKTAGEFYGNMLSKYNPFKR